MMNKCRYTEGPQRFSAPQHWFVLDEPVVREGWPDATAVCVVLNPPDVPGVAGSVAGIAYESGGTIYPADAADMRIVEGPALLDIPRGSGLDARGALRSIGIDVHDQNPEETGAST